MRTARSSRSSKATRDLVGGEVAERKSRNRLVDDPLTNAKLGQDERTVEQRGKKERGIAQPARRCVIRLGMAPSRCERREQRGDDEASKTNARPRGEGFHLADVGGE
jgi:hypothetical protein